VQAEFSVLPRLVRLLLRTVCDPTISWSRGDKRGAMNAVRNRIGKNPSRRLPPPVVVQRPSSLNGVVAVVANPNPNHGTTLAAAAAAAVDDDDDSYLVSCRCESAKAVSSLLSCLHCSLVYTVLPLDPMWPSEKYGTAIRRTTAVAGGNTTARPQRQRLGRRRGDAHRRGFNQ
jgi:hypothetical protein